MAFWTGNLYNGNLRWLGYTSSNGRCFFKKKLVWNLFYLGCGFDELFSRLIINLNRSLTVVPAIFIFDRWLLIIIGPLYFKNMLFWLNTKIFVVNTDIVSLLNKFVTISILVIMASNFIWL